jgi:hypothetical protein
MEWRPADPGGIRRHDASYPQTVLKSIIKFLFEEGFYKIPRKTDFG